MIANDVSQKYQRIIGIIAYCDVSSAIVLFNTPHQARRSATRRLFRQASECQWRIADYLKYNSLLSIFVMPRSFMPFAATMTIRGLISLGLGGIITLNDNTRLAIDDNSKVLTRKRDGAAPSNFGVSQNGSIVIDFS